MNNILWHIDSALLGIVHKPLIVFSIIFVILLIVIVICIVRANGESNDS